jgi:tRNA (guanine-N7-)-methyltransferase
MSFSDLIPAPRWSEVFGRKAPLDLEIGFGNGEYLNRSSLEAPERDFVGLEISWPSVKRALRRLASPPRRNAKLVCLAAGPALARCFPEESVSVARALFPVPWPKERHAKKRLFSRAFLDLLASRLAPSGVFMAVTDDPGLASWALAQSRDSALPLTLTEREGALDTKYGRKWEGLGASVFYHLEGVKARHPELPAARTPDMQPRFLDSLDPESYRPDGITGETAVIFRELVFDHVRREGLLPVKVVEGDFIQEFFIRLKQDPDGRYRLYPALPHLVFPTEGVKIALDLAAGETPVTGKKAAPQDPADGSGLDRQDDPTESPEDGVTDGTDGTRGPAAGRADA